MKTAVNIVQYAVKDGTVRLRCWPGGNGVPIQHLSCFENNSNSKAGYIHLAQHLEQRIISAIPGVFVILADANRSFSLVEEEHGNCNIAVRNRWRSAPFMNYENGKRGRPNSPMVRSAITSKDFKQ